MSWSCAIRQLFVVMRRPARTRFTPPPYLADAPLPGGKLGERTVTCAGRDGAAVGQIGCNNAPRWVRSQELSFCRFLYGPFLLHLKGKPRMEGMLR